MLTGRYFLSALHGLRDLFSFSWRASPDSSVEFCRAQLLENHGCCLDETCDPSVVQQRIRRPGTSWQCIAAEGCVSEPGVRGDDLLSIPAGAACDCRILFLHGGSWYFGSPNSTGYHVLASKLAARTGCVVMVPDFALLPVGNFNSMLQASVEALQWLATHVLEKCKAEPPVRLYVGGDSSGATTALSLVFRLGQQPDLIPKGSQLVAGFMWSPWTNLMCDTPDYVTNAYSTIFNANSSSGKSSDYRGDILFKSPPAMNMAEFRNVALQYVGGQRDLLVDPIASPFHAGASILAMVPPLYFLVGSEETLLGDSVILAQKAAAYGASIVVDVYDNMWHDFPMYSEGCGSGSKLWLGNKAWENTAEFIQLAQGAQGSNGWPLLRYVYDESPKGRDAWFAPRPPLRLPRGSQTPEPVSGTSSSLSLSSFLWGLGAGAALASCTYAGMNFVINRQQQLQQSQRAVPLRVEMTFRHDYNQQ